MQASIMQPCSVQLVRRPASRRQRRARTLKVLAVVLLALLFVFLAPRAVEMMSHTGAPATVTYTVTYGDTLWEIAARHSGETDVRQVIAAIKRANNLQTATVHPGQELVIPTVR